MRDNLLIQLCSCHRCHSQKTKCSGKRPCDGCLSTGRAEECQFPAKERKIRVDERSAERRTSEIKADKPPVISINSKKRTGVCEPSLPGARHWETSESPQIAKIKTNLRRCPKRRVTCLILSLTDTRRTQSTNGLWSLDSLEKHRALLSATDSYHASTIHTPHLRRAYPTTIASIRGSECQCTRVQSFLNACMSSYC